MKSAKLSKTKIKDANNEAPGHIPEADQSAEEKT